MKKEFEVEEKDGRNIEEVGLEIGGHLSIAQLFGAEAIRHEQSQENAAGTPIFSTPIFSTTAMVSSLTTTATLSMMGTVPAHPNSRTTFVGTEDPHYADRVIDKDEKVESFDELSDDMIDLPP